ncbi:hypothetical protein [Nodosilinea sp. P-1105]|uniref:hypothetical protein n=1 Tax=Nodosilinea sp. P-1105 TaxID=2546229 RepID=UPI00146CF9A2|nr:hypothetical protein [Nodosilinea sp. P-1105]NMF83791.1 hypothetical protein [Nodosilinea sp. P-1105]
MAGQPTKTRHTRNILWFDLTELSVFDQVPTPPLAEFQDPLSIVPVTSDFVVQVKFEMGGFVASHYANGRHNYTVKVFAESIGPGPEKEIGELHASLVANQLQYTNNVRVTAGTLTELGVYKLVATVTFDVPPPSGPAMIGFSDSPIMIQIKNPLH